MLEVIRTDDAFAALEQEWNALYSVTPDPVPFQNFAFCRAAWKFVSARDRHSELHILIWIRKGLKLAIFPLYIDGKHNLRFINDRHMDFCGPVLRPDVAGNFHMCEDIAEHIRGCREIRRICLDNMRSDLFQSSLQLQLKGTLLYPYKRWSFFRMSGDRDAKSAIDTLDQLTTKEKYRLKNIYSKMVKAGAGWKIYNISETAWPSELIDSLCNAMIVDGIRKDKYFSPDFVAFLRSAYDSGELSVCATLAEDGAVACNLFLHSVFSNEYIDWIALYRDPSSNSWNLLQFMDYLHSNGGGTVNFARNIYKYKTHNYRPVIRSLDRLRYSKNIFSRAGDVADCLVCCIKRMHRSK